MLVKARTGWEPLKMTYIRFNGILARIHKINRSLPGGGITREQALAERIAEARASQEEEP
jgi:hypothetical protein